MCEMICGQCGSEMPEDTDFCYRCGAMRRDDAEEICRRCGSVRGPNVECALCGPISEHPAGRLPSQRRMTAILLAALPGFFDVFGLGHIFMGRFRTGALFLCVSALLIAAQLLYDLSEWNKYITMGTLLLFMIQIGDIFRITSK